MGIHKKEVFHSMNVLFFLTTKDSVTYVTETDNIGSVLDKMRESGFTAIPLLGKDGRYIGTITEGDLLWNLEDKDHLERRELRKKSIQTVKRRRDNQEVNVMAHIDDLIDKVVNQNFVPVVDDNGVFIGIVTRKDVLTHLVGEARKNK